MSKYIKGEKIANLNQLVELIKNKKSIFFLDWVRNYAWLENQQFHKIIGWIEGGWLFEAKEKNKNENEV